jgi:hypothetical protein
VQRGTLGHAGTTLALSKGGDFGLNPRARQPPGRRVSPGNDPNFSRKTT